MARADTVSELVQRGRAAAARGSWREAYDFLVVVEFAELGPEDLELIGEASSWSGPTEACIEARERAYSGYLASGDRKSAARVALDLVRDYRVTQAGAVAAGWFKRAERLLADEAECREHGYLAYRQGLAADAQGDVIEARQQVLRAFEIAQRFGDRDLEALSLHYQGYILVREGQVADGWALIDEAAATAATGDLRPTATGSVYCGTISACRDLFEFRRAGEWTTRFERWCERTSLPGGWRGDCRVHRAEVLRLRGRWTEAEEEATSACNDFLECNISEGVGEASYELGEIRLRRGDIAGAEEAFRRALEVGAETQPGLALLRLAQGKPRVGLAELARTLSEVPEDRMRRARLLPAFIEIAIAADDLDAARDAVAELDALAAAYSSDALMAAACWSRGLVLGAEGNAAAAVTKLREASRRWQALEAPYEAAWARLALGEAYRATGDDDAAELELETAHSALDRLGAAVAARRAADLLQRGRVRPATGTFLFSDICGSTSLVEAIGDEAWLSLVEWHDRTLRALFAEHGGQEVDHAGDGFFVAFGEAASAVACAVGIQRALAEHRRDHGFAPRVRIGVHNAEAIPAAGSFRGKGVHAAARIGAIAAENEIVASRETAEAGQVPFANPRTLTLKGLSAPIEVVTVDWT